MLTDVPLNMLERIAAALESIATALEGLLESTNPIKPIDSQLLEADDKVRAFYTDESADIVREHLHKMGKEPKE